MRQKLITALAGTLLFVLVLITIYVTHVRLFAVDVVFYAALVDVGLAGAVMAALLLATGPRAGLGGFERLLLVTIWLLIGYCLAISVPTVLDRSLSFYILEKLDQRGGALTADSLPDVFTQEYVAEYKLVEVRLTEQLASGTITLTDGCVRLTARGRALARLARFFQQELLPRQRRLMDGYSSVLTQSFSDGVPAAGVTCAP